MAGYTLVFGTLNSKGLAPQMQTSFETHRAIVSKLIVDIYMRSVIISILNQIDRGFYFINRRTNRQKWTIKTMTVESYKLIVMIS